MANPTVMFNARLPPSVYDGVQAVASTVNVDMTTIAIRALHSYLLRCGHDPGIVQDMKDAENAKAAVKSLSERDRLSQARIQDLEQALNEALKELKERKEKEDARVQAKAEAAHLATVKASERNDLERAKLMASRPGVFRDTLMALAEAEEKDPANPHRLIQPKEFHLLLRRAFGNYRDALKAVA